MPRPFLERLWALLQPKQPEQWGRGLSADMLLPAGDRVLVITPDRPLTQEQTDRVRDRIRSMAPGWTVLVLPPGFTAEVTRASDEA